MRRLGIALRGFLEFTASVRLARRVETSFRLTFSFSCGLAFIARALEAFLIILDCLLIGKSEGASCSPGIIEVSVKLQ